MDKDNIAALARQMETKEDFLALLNYVKQNDMETCGLADKYYPFTMKHINYYCNPRHSFHRYKEFKIKKKSGGYRQITAPRNRSFMLILHYTNEILKSIYKPSDYAMGFCEGRSIADNASLHKGHNYIFNIDLKDFFPSIEQARVWKRLQLKPFGFPVSIANIIAGLCSMKEIREIDGERKEFYVLPQGAPTSPIITNMICDNLDRKLAGLAKRFGLTYSRYADDITFSSMHNVYHEKGDFQKELRRIIAGQNFTVNEDKTRLQKRGARQEVTGLTISDKINVSQKYIREIRNLLYIWEHWGLTVAQHKFIPEYKDKKGHVKKGIPNLVNVLEGKLMYLKMIRGENDSVYLRLYSNFCKLVEMLHGTVLNTNRAGVTYIETFPLEEIERKLNQKITIQTGENGYRFATFFIGSLKQMAFVNRKVNLNVNSPNNSLSLSYCRDHKGKVFWLIHESRKMTRFLPKNVDINELNKDLDKLLAI